MRLAAVVGKVPFEDDRVTFARWPAIKPTTPLGSLPVATVDSKTVVQTMALLRYIGKLGGLIPECPIQALQVDQVVETTNDFFYGIFSYNGVDKDLLRASREKHLAEGGERYWGGCEKIIKGISNGPFVLGEKVTIADVAIAAVYILLKIEFLDYLPKDGLDRYEGMKKIFDSVMALPQVVEYHKKHPIPGCSA